jgi:phospholipid/cholesterol/gamma-HCH transport system ATP-binding protein
MAIDVRNLRVRYGTREILHGVSFEVPAGETLVIMGGSGSGKSTLLRTLVGLERPSEGEIWIHGKNFAAMTGREHEELRKRMGMSFQSGALFGSMTVGENVALPLREHTPLDESTIDIMVRLKLDQVGLTGFDNYMPAQLSGGMKKRAAIARALVIEPQLILYDEPTSELDPLSAVVMGEEILKLKQRIGVTSLVVSHDRDLAFGIADRIAFITDGRIVAILPPAEMKQSRDPAIIKFLCADFKHEPQEKNL